MPTALERQRSQRRSLLLAGGLVTVLVIAVLWISETRSTVPNTSASERALDQRPSSGSANATNSTTNTSPGPSLGAISAVRALLSAQQFLLDAPIRYEPFGDDLRFDRGYILVLETDPRITLRTPQERPVLYVGAIPAWVVDVASPSGRVIAIAPGDIDLAETPIFFGSTVPPERVDGARGRAERDVAVALGVSPPPGHELAGAIAAGGAILQAQDMSDLRRRLDAIRTAWSKVDAGSARVGSRVR
ncbi:MAG: hypothetical protein R3E97_16090 [Candidatus Eisenbacteria bacterium]